MAYEGAGIWLFRRLKALRIFETLPAGFKEQLKAQAFAAAMRGLQVEEEALATLREMQDLAPNMAVPAGWILEKTAHLYQPGTRRPYGVLEWPAMLRLLEAEQKSSAFPPYDA